MMADYATLTRPPYRKSYLYFEESRMDNLHFLSLGYKSPPTPLFQRGEPDR